MFVRRRLLARGANQDKTAVATCEINRVSSSSGRAHDGIAEKHSTCADKEMSQFPSSSSSATYVFTKWLIMRGTAAIYLFAFLAAYFQNEGLLGKHGLKPAGLAFARLQALYVQTGVGNIGQYDYQGSCRGFMDHPTIFWFVPLSDLTMQMVVIVGLLLSSVALFGVNSWLIQVLLWLLYFSIVTIASIATSFYQYGWESQLLETGFLSIFLCPLPSFRDGRFRLAIFEGPYKTEQPSSIILWLFSWLCFRISLGAGLIKVRGSSCWTRRTCLYYHFETQPIPSPLSFFFHFLPRPILSLGVDVDLIVQLYTSWSVLIIPLSLMVEYYFPVCSRNRRLSQILYSIGRVGGWTQVGFMLNIALSGNFAFLNHLTIIPALATLDDNCWPRYFTKKLVAGSSKNISSVASEAVDSDVVFRPTSGVTVSSWLLSRKIMIDLPLLCWILFLSQPVIANLFQSGGSRQVMNRSFGSFRLVNTYGAFGSVGEARFEAIVMIGDDLSNTSTWTELEFPCKPGSPTRRPCFCAPYHYRLDWNIWFIGFKPHKSYLRERESWLYDLLFRLLQPSDHATGITPRPWLALLDARTAMHLETKYYNNGNSPRYAKVDMYHYRMAAPLWTLLAEYCARILKAATGSSQHEDEPVLWWERRFEENLIPPVMIDSGSSTLQYAQ